MYLRNIFKRIPRNQSAKEGSASDVFAECNTECGFVTMNTFRNQWRLVVFVLEEASQNVRDIYLCAVKNLFFEGCTFI
jgi:hypothetical protein